MKTASLLALTSLVTVTLFANSTVIKAEDNYHYDYATVMQSKPVYRIVEMSRLQQQCKDEEVVYQQSRRKSSGNSLVGGILGAAVGHALGHRSKHRTGATIAGAIVGASIADDNPRVVTQRRGIQNNCKMVPTRWEEERIIGYNVVYRYNGRTFETRLPFEPGDSLKIRVMIVPMADASERSDQ